MKIVAEISGNHCQDLELALKLVKAAKDAGADAVKLQTYTADSMIADQNDPLWALYDSMALPYEYHEPIFNYVKEIGITAFSAPFSIIDLEFLETLDCPIYKVASLEINDLELINAIASTGKPIIISTGGATLGEIRDAVTVAKRSNNSITLLKCTSSYPAEIDTLNLKTIPALKDQFPEVEIGYSDHTGDYPACIAASALDAEMIEAHIRLPLEEYIKHDKEPPDGFAFTPERFKLLVEYVHSTKAAIGKVSYGQSNNSAMEYRRSLYFAQDIHPGMMITKDDIRTARPNKGLHPILKNQIIGQIVTREIKAGEPITKEFLP